MRKAKYQTFLTKILLLALCLIGVAEVHAQITGRIIDNSKNAIPYCNVLLKRTSDTSLVTGATTDTSGNFQLEIKDTGNFRIVIANIGYKKFYSPFLLISKGTSRYNAGTIMLEADAQVLKGVQIVAEKPFIEHKLDRTVFNIENSIISAGNDALEVLRKLPGVTVDNNDAIQVRGKPGVLITIDGRTSYMSSEDVATYLRGLNASQIEKIEVITNPSAKYDAAGSAVINIILKKDKNLGFNAQLNAAHSQGFYGTSNGGFNANYRIKKFNFFGSYNEFINRFYVGQDRQSTFSTNGEPVSIFNDQMRRIFVGNGGNGRIGIDFTPNDKHTIGIVAEGFFNKRTDSKEDATDIKNGNSVLDSSLHMHGATDLRINGLTYSLNYKFKIDSLGKELSANADYSTFSISSNDQDITSYSDGNEQFLHAPTVLQYDLLSDLTIRAAKVDYAQPLGKKAKLETGLKSSLVNSDNNGQYWNILNGLNMPDTTKTNHFIYSENINAGYLNFSRSLSEKIEAQIGLRAEQTQSKGTQLVNNSTVKRNYINLFPSAFISWKVDSSHTLNLSYSRRVERPGYGQLNPFFFYSNPYNYEGGNPYLRPQLSDNLELTHIFKGFLSSSIGYLHMTDAIAPVMHQNDTTHVVYRLPDNLNTWNCYNIMVVATLHPRKWWTAMITANLFHDHYFGYVKEGFYSNSHFTGDFFANNSFSLKNNWSFELNGYYRTVNIFGVTINEPIYRFAVGIKKRFAEGRGTMALNCEDILWSDHLVEKEIFQNVNYRNTFYRDSRRINLSLSWKLGKSQYKREEKEKSATEEINRVNKG